MLSGYKTALIIFSSVIVTSSLIYFTPLRYTDLIEPSIRDIDPIVFYEKYKKNPDYYIFIDVRGEDSYNKMHAQGSVNIPLHNLYNERHSLPKKEREIILICSRARASGVAYSYLQHYGFTNISRISGGIEQWIAEGLPTESSLQISSTDFKNIEGFALFNQETNCIG